MQDEPHAHPKKDGAAQRGNESLKGTVREASSKQKKAWNKTAEYFGKWEGWISFLTFIALVVYTIVTIRLWNAQTQANGISRKILAATESSQVYFGNVKLAGRVQPDDSWKEDVMVEIGDSGGSPTRDLELRLTCKPSERMLSHPFDVASLAAAKIQHLVLAPKQPPVTPIACALSSAELALTNIARLSVYVFGEADYRDTMQPHQTHHIEFCTRLHEFAAGDGMIAAASEYCDHHNCIDDECEDQRRTRRGSEPGHT